MLWIIVLVAIATRIRRIRRRRAFERAAYKVRTLGPAWGHAREPHHPPF